MPKQAGLYQVKEMEQITSQNQKVSCPDRLPVYYTAHLRKVNDASTTVFQVPEVRNASIRSDIRTAQTKSNRDSLSQKPNKMLTHQTQPGIKRIEHSQLGRIPGRQYKFVCVNNPDAENKDNLCNSLMSS